jgi:hypothetical protein
MVRRKIQEKLIRNPIWLLISEAAKLAGVSDKTIRRAVKEVGGLKFRIVNGRYHVELLSVIEYMERNTKLTNRLNTFGIGQYIKEYNRKRGREQKVDDRNEVTEGNNNDDNKIEVNHNTDNQEENKVN